MEHQLTESKYRLWCLWTLRCLVIWCTWRYSMVLDIEVRIDMIFDEIDSRRSARCSLLNFGHVKDLYKKIRVSGARHFVQIWPTDDHRETTCCVLWKRIDAVCRWRTRKNDTALSYTNVWVARPQERNVSIRNKSKGRKWKQSNTLEGSRKMAREGYWANWIRLGRGAASRIFQRQERCYSYLRFDTYGSRI